MKKRSGLLGHVCAVLLSAVLLASAVPAAAEDMLLGFLEDAAMEYFFGDLLENEEEIEEYLRTLENNPEIVEEAVLEYLFGDLLEDDSLLGDYLREYLGDEYAGGGYDDGGQDSGAPVPGWTQFDCDSEYYIYVDDKTGYLFGMFTDGTAYIAGHRDYYGRSPSRKTDLKLPATVMGVKVSEIGDNAFAYLENIGTVKIPEGIQQIGVSAFEGCDLRRVSLPSSLEGIEYDAFLNCTQLEEVSFPKGMTYIGSAAFYGCTSLTGVTLPDSVEEVFDEAFGGCTALKSVHIGKGLHTMAGNAFLLCPQLKKLTVDPANRTFEVRGGVLYNNEKNSLVCCPAGAVSGKTFAIEQGVKTVEIGCISADTTIERITVPDSVETIEEYAFFGCTELTYIELGRGVKTIKECAIPTNSMRGIWFPDSLNSLTEMSLFNRTDHPTLGDDFEFTIIANEGTYAAQWAAQYDFIVLPPTQEALASIGAVPQEGVRVGMLSVPRETVFAGEKAKLVLQAGGWTGVASFYLDGEAIGTAEIKNGRAELNYETKTPGAYRVSVLVGFESVASAPLIIQDAKMSVQPKDEPAHCDHLAGKMIRDTIVDRTYAQLSGQEKTVADEEDCHREHMVQRYAFVCTVCGEYFVEEPSGMSNLYKLHSYDKNGVCVCGRRQEKGYDPRSRYQLRWGDVHTEGKTVYVKLGDVLHASIYDSRLKETSPMRGGKLELLPVGDDGVITVDAQDHSVSVSRNGQQEIALYYCGEEVDRFLIYCTEFTIVYGDDVGKRKAIGTNVILLENLDGFDWFWNQLMLNSELGIENFSAEWQEGGYLVEFDALNGSPVSFGVFSYDNSGKLHERQYISGYWRDESFMDRAGDTLESFANLAMLRSPLRYLDIEKTHVKLTVPAGGSLRFLMPTEDERVERINEVCMALGLWSVAANIGECLPELAKVFNTDAGQELIEELLEMDELDLIEIGLTAFDDGTVNLVRDEFPIGEVLGILGKAVGGKVWDKLKDRVLELGGGPTVMVAQAFAKTAGSAASNIRFLRDLDVIYNRNLHNQPDTIRFPDR